MGGSSKRPLKRRIHFGAKISGIVKKWKEYDAPCNNERYSQQEKILARNFAFNWFF